ncbi:WD40-repeat-containing domain protein [Suillus subalutaceus]|uniref:WD40-repeat-containing domain protein n=1 Tax=Suillus subalutaceus TaxID=48586 RepID=UPI001B85D314|nr:WD40-repeat-containing domain protein [Suillus subalutaceus]KAG1838039.1 WD40-repeat-containing domain protein [Suillus subalutaceus]
MSSSTNEMPVITPRKTMQGHTSWVRGVVHLPGGRHILTCSTDGSRRLWDLESGIHIGDDWKDEEDNAGVWSMALSPNGQTVASGHNDGKVRLWDVETMKVIVEWTRHAHVVCALCWSADGNQVLSGSWDGTARVWDVESSKTVLTIKTGHNQMRAVIYSPDATKIATGGLDENAVKIWNAKTGNLLNTLKHDNGVWGLAWTSDGKKLISGSGPNRIFDTATWEKIAVLETDHLVTSISLSRNNRFLASGLSDETARLWNLDTNLPIGPPLYHEDGVCCVALSADGKLLVTGCQNGNAYTWDIHAILKEAGLEDLLQPLSNVPAQKSLMDSNAARRPPIQARRIQPAFFDGVQSGAQSSTARGTHRSLANNPRTSLLEHFSSLFHYSHRNTNDATELRQRPRRSIFFRGPPIVEVPLVKDREVIFTAPPPPQKAQQQTQSHAQDTHIHYPSVCWLILCFFSAVHLLNMPMPMHNQHSSKANHNVKSSSRHQCRLSLPPLRYPRHFLLLLLVLPHQVQRLCIHDLFHCELASCCFLLLLCISTT